MSARYLAQKVFLPLFHLFHDPSFNDFKPSTVEVIKDKAEEHDDLQCDFVNICARQKKIMKKYMNTKHKRDLIAKECNSKDTSEMVKDQQEQTETNEKKDKDNCWMLKRINVLDVIKF